jgi:hypothetical protein
MWMLLDSAQGWRWPAVAVTGSIALVAALAVVVRLRTKRNFGAFAQETGKSLPA